MEKHFPLLKTAHGTAIKKTTLENTQNSIPIFAAKPGYPTSHEIVTVKHRPHRLNWHHPLTLVPDILNKCLLMKTAQVTAIGKTTPENIRKPIPIVTAKPGYPKSRDTVTACHLGARKKQQRLAHENCPRHRHLKTQHLQTFKTPSPPSLPNLATQSLTKLSRSTTDRTP